MHIVTIFDTLKNVIPKQGEKMEEKNEVKDGCGKCAGAEKKICGAAFGEALASAAIAEMNEEESPRTEATAFLAKCKREGKHPIEVVKRVADHYGIKVSEEPPTDEAKRKVYFLLKEVVRQYVEVTMTVFRNVVDDGEEDDFSEFITNVFSFTW